MITLQETALLGSIAKFARSGETIDAVTVGKNAMPDDDPITNWDNLDCVYKSKFESELKDFGNKECFDGVNYTEIPVRRVVRDEVMISTQNMSSLIDELQFGLDAAPTPDGAAVNAFANSDRKIYGWLWFQGVRVGSGGVAKDLKMWGYFELETGYEFQPGVSEQALKFTHESGSSLGAPIQFKTAV